MSFPARLPKRSVVLAGLAGGGARPGAPPATADEPAATASVACAVPSNRDLKVTRTVYQVGVGLGVSPKVMLAGFEAGWVESHMNNLSCGDADSLGVFQQRSSQGWGTAAEILDVR